MQTEPEIRLAMCSAGELFGGVERHLLGMCTWLLRQGRQPRLVVFHDRELARQARALGVEPHVIETNGPLDISVPGKLARLFASHEVNMVHVHGYKAVVNCSLARRHHSFAMVRTVHGLVEPGDGLGLAWLKPRIYTWLERSLGRMASAGVTYVTDDLRRQHAHQDAGLVSQTVYNGIDPLCRADYERPADYEPGRFHLAAVGRVSEVKGLSYLIEAVANLNPELGVVLNIIGTGPLAAPLQELAEKKGLGDRVRFLGFKDHVYGYLAHCDALVMPSLHEGLPYTLLEALSMGVPIVAARVGGLAEVLIESDHTILVAPRAVAELTEALVDIHAFGEQDSDAGRDLRASEFSFGLDKMGEAFQRLYENECKQARAT